MTKICTSCKNAKPLLEFCKHSKCKDGYTNLCKSCKRARDIYRYGKKKVEILAENLSYRKKHKAEICLQAKEKYQSNKSQIKARVLSYQKRNPEKCKKWNQKYRLTHKKQFQEYQRQYRKQKRANDINFKLRCNISSRITNAIQHNRKKSNVTQLIGCTIQELKQHLEKLFRTGMTWSNYSHDGWHIDHIIPCASFDLSKIDEQKKCFHYTNLQPLWAIDNHRKGDRY